MKSDFVSNNGFSSEPISWPDLVALKQLFDLNQDEVLAMREMSKAYLDGHRIGEDVFGIPPWEGE